VREPETHYADSDGVSIAYQVHGSGPLDLVFVPGFVSHVETYMEDPSVARFFRRLSSFSRLIVFDKREQGLSDRTGRPPTLEESMDDLKAVMEAAGCERPAIFGISKGGPMSMLFAATHPDRVSSLVLYGTFARLSEAPDYPRGLPPAAFDRWVEMVKREWGGPVGIDLWAPSLVGDTGFERSWAYLLRHGTSPAGAIALLDLYREIDARAALAAIDVPALVLHRRDDRVVRIDHGIYLAERIPKATFVELDGTDHVFFADQDALLDEIEEFLVGSRRGSEPERALATILFTDIVGSTEKAATLGDRGWRQLLERHDAAVRHQLGLYRGREVKTMGDASSPPSTDRRERSAAPPPCRRKWRAWGSRCGPVSIPARSS
jgi:pimeloyl-ACP methyl ester carboxylesterase